MVGLSKDAEDPSDVLITQGEMNMMAYNKAESSRKEMMRLIEEIRVLYAEEEHFLVRLDVCQKKWQEYADAMLDMQYSIPEGGSYMYYYGSFLPTAYSDSYNELLERRIQDLRKWTEGKIEGDLGEGLIYTKRRLQRIRQQRGLLPETEPGVEQPEEEHSVELDDEKGGEDEPE